ncbi:MAG: FAD:protein FMN transferase, partial [Myxococcota bacterium]
EVVELSDQGLATSGDYRAFYVEDGQRISHTIDPRTGRPIANGMASATVIAPTATQADGFATALMVLGPEQGLALAEQWKLGAMTLVRTADGGFSEARNTLYPEPIGPDLDGPDRGSAKDIGAERATEPAVGPAAAPMPAAGVEPAAGEIARP